jgi:hypothetical protein
MIATKIQKQHPEAVSAIARWKNVWRAATFGLDEDHERLFHDGELDAHELLRDFGSQLVELGKEVWKTQADALEKAPYIQKNTALSDRTVRPRKHHSRMEHLNEAWLVKLGLSQPIAFGHAIAYSHNVYDKRT